MVGGELTDAPRHGHRCPFKSELVDLEPGQPQVIPMMEALVGNLVGVKSCYKRFIGRCDAR